MIDLDEAAHDLATSVAHVQPDLEGVQARARRRQQRRRIGGALAAVVLLAAGAAGAVAVTGGDDVEGVQTADTTTTTTTTSAPTDPIVTGPAAPVGQRFVDVGDLRVAVPGSWSVIDATQDETGCGGEATVVLGPQAANSFCPEPTALRVEQMEEPLHGGGGEAETRNGIAVVPLAEEPNELWAVPDLGMRLTFGPGADVEAILGSILPSARQTARADIEAGAPPQWRFDTANWQTVQFDGIAVYVPADWRATDLPFDTTQSPNPCAAWSDAAEPGAYVGPSADPTCAPNPGQPADGVWLLPLEGATVAAEESAETTHTRDTEVEVVWAQTGTVLEAIVPPRGKMPATLVRIGLGVDGHIASSIVASIGADPWNP